MQQPATSNKPLFDTSTYRQECIAAGMAFKRFLDELRAQGHAFDVPDAELAQELDDRLGLGSPFEATFFMVARGLSLTEAADAQRSAG